MKQFLGNKNILSNEKWDKNYKWFNQADTHFYPGWHALQSLVAKSKYFAESGQIIHWFWDK